MFAQTTLQQQLTITEMVAVVDSDRQTNSLCVCFLFFFAKPVLLSFVAIVLNSVVSVGAVVIVDAVALAVAVVAVASFFCCCC